MFDRARELKGCHESASWGEHLLEDSRRVSGN